MIDPVTRWFKITQYDYKKVISIAYLVETTWLSRSSIPMEIMHGLLKVKSSNRNGCVLIHMIIFMSLIQFFSQSSNFEEGIY